MQQKPAYCSCSSSGGSSAPFYSKVVPVTTATDMQGALRSDVLYVLDGVIDFTGTGIEVQVPSGGLSIGGHTFDTSGMICSDDNYTMFVSEVGGSGGVLQSDCYFSVTGANSKVYDLTDATGNNTIELTKVNFINCTSLGEINGYRQGLESITARIGGTPELTMSGTWAGGYRIDASIAIAMDNSAFSIFKEGTGFVMASRFITNQIVDLPAIASFTDFTPSNFTNPSTVQLVGCRISRNGVINAEDTSIIPNLTAGDLVCAWSGNTGIRNTFVGGSLKITTETETNITTANQFVDLAGTYTSEDLQHFDSPSNGHLRHIGDSPIEFNLVGDLILDSGSNDEITLKVVIFRDATSSFEDGASVTRVINNLQGGRDVGYFYLDDDIVLNTNDYVKLQVANTDTSNVTAELESFFKIRARK